MKRALVLVLLACSVAHAEERTTTVTLGGMAGLFEQSHDHASGADVTWYADDAYAPVETLFGPRVTLAWEHAPLAIPAVPGVVFDGRLVPELFAGGFIDDTSAQLLVGAGVRAELAMAQREMGLLRLSARGAVYLAARGMVIGDKRDAVGELAIGDYLYIGKSTRLGVEGGLLFARSTPMTDPERSTSLGGIIQFYVGWAP